MEFFRNTNIDFLGKKWYFLSFSLIFSIAGVLSMMFWHGIPLGVDFRGGTLVYVKFADAPNDAQIRASLDHAGLHTARIQRYGEPGSNEVVIALDEKETSEANLSRGKNQIIAALETNPPQGKQDINNSDKVGFAAVRDALATRDPLRAAPAEYDRIAREVLDARDKQHGGVLKTLDELKGVVPDAALDSLKQDFYTSNFGVRSADIVGPQVGEQLKKQARLAVIFSLIGMLVYLWFRFELIYGVAAVVAVFHDTLITIGAFSLTNKEITLTVIAAILTLVGYSMNDTIVVFDRIRENVKLLRRESLAEIVNRSINQTLSRTILTSGLTFLTVLSLYLFGGEVLSGFSFALVIGILIGTYSSIAVAAPMLVAYQDWRTSRSGSRTVPMAAQTGKGPATPGKGKVRAKV
ncbi:MAG TPA: protein translocase subunit SecF [Candidatus Limnocylindrales bacterium]|nr:protein translocase subunit SecF [Candidatus Limnocylindrales bacterium]